jgi:hypothetical protein
VVAPVKTSRRRRSILAASVRAGGVLVVVVALEGVEDGGVVPVTAAEEAASGRRAVCGGTMGRGLSVRGECWGCQTVVYVTELGPHCCVCDICGDEVAVGVV